MSKTVDQSLLLAKYYDAQGIKHTVSIADYMIMEYNKDKGAIAGFIFNRLHSRYLKPFQFPETAYAAQYKNGFSIMANCCMLIETLESFKQGLGSSNRQSEKLFVDFLTTDTNFTDFRSNESDFYTHIRCGILHQGETTGGWIIGRSGKRLFDAAKLKVDAFCFMDSLQESLQDYCLLLQSSDWSDPIWQNFLTKMSVSIAHCAK
ncbi:hypothetical protein [Flavobacterium ginsenosidimutans]|uniref:hypothetical protein n=1 Tax=Flavobacterium ginsenosidimutans TaxID=687844 RepID=UPI003D96D08A